MQLAAPHQARRQEPQIAMNTIAQKEHTPQHHRKQRPRGPMEKASAHRAGDCKSESCLSHIRKRTSNKRSRQILETAHIASRETQRALHTAPLYFLLVRIVGPHPRDPDSSPGGGMYKIYKKAFAGKRTTTAGRAQWISSQWP